MEQIVASDTLRVVTMYGVTSYFLFRDETMGFDYEMAQNLARNLGLELKISIAQNESEMAQMIKDGDADVAAYNIINTKTLKKDFAFVLPQTNFYQVLVQPLTGKSVSDVTELVGKTVYVTPNSVYYSRLRSLNDEIGGGINIEIVDDSVSSDDLIEMVAANKIQYTVAAHDLALLYKSYYRRLDCHLPLGFKQRGGWVVDKRNTKLQQAIEFWQNNPEVQEEQALLRHKYWNRSPYFSMRKMKIPKGAISVYDHLFKKYAPMINWDWRLLAAVAFHESRFDATQVSWAGAAGLMQLMPRTAASFGLDKANKFDPEMNIEAGVQYIKSLNLAFRKVENKDERIKFILAGYNSGPAHIFDAMALAKKYGKNPGVWTDNVEYFLIKKREPEFYNDPVVKNGIFRATETVRYVKNTLETYNKYLNRR